jgi:Secretion system C-terminal sorting domain
VLVCEIDLANNQSNVCINKNALNAKVRPGKPAYCGPCHEAQCVSNLTANQVSNLLAQTPTSKARNVIDKITLKLYPNPSSGSFNVDIRDFELNQKSTLSIYSAMGTLIYNQPINFTDQLNIQLDSRLAPSGMYTLILSTSGKSIVKRFVIQH